jgi:hypothetical protein
MNNEDYPYERLLRAQVGSPSERFERRLSRIPMHSEVTTFPLLSYLRPLALAATLLLTVLMVINRLHVVEGPTMPTLVRLEALEEAPWLDLLALADPLDGAQSLADTEQSFAIEYFAFNP